MSNQYIKRLISIITFVLPLVVVAGCRESAQQNTLSTDAGSTGITIQLVQDGNFVTGETVLDIQLLDADGNLITDATSVNIRGDMNHAGMSPMFGGVDQGSDGVYRVPFNYTMGGEWILTVTATLADGNEIAQEFTVEVDS